MSIRIGIAGFGKIGKIRHDILAKRKDCQIVGIFEKNIDHQSNSSYNYFKSIDELLNNVDAVVISTFNDSLAEFTKKAINKNIHVFCEKPPARTVDELKGVQNALNKKKQIVLKYGFNHRYHHSVIEAKSKIDKGTYGKLLFSRGIYGKAGSIDYRDNWRNYKKISGGGILLDQGIHMLDLMLYLSGSEMKLLKSQMSNLHWDIECEDNVFAMFTNEQNSIFTLHSSATHWSHKFLLELFYENGYIILDGILSQTMSYAPEKLITAKKSENTNIAMGKLNEKTLIFDNDISWESELNEFLECIKNKKTPINGNIKDAMQVLNLVEEIYKRNGQ